MATIDRRKLLATGTLAAAGLAATAAAGQANTLNPPEPETLAISPEGRFADKVVLITGATSGIGETTAKAFAQEGAKVAFNNAGIFMTPAEIQEMDLDNYRDMIATNLDGVFYAMRYELPVMIKQNSGIIINMASVAGHRGFANTPHYNASKHGVIGLTKAAATANAQHNIRINSISPLAVDTPMLRRSFEYQGLAYEQMTPNFVTPRIMTTHEMARAVMFLASNEATSINGMDLDVTGGQLA